jgi:hypothetical protein
MFLLGARFKEFVAENRTLSITAALVGILVSVFPWLLWDKMWTLPVDIASDENTTEYRFRDTMYANDFFELNYSDEDVPTFL